MKICQILHVIFQTTNKFFFLFRSNERDQSECRYFRLFSAQIKIHQVLVIFETKNWFFFKFYITLQYHEIYITPLYVFSWHCIYFQQKEPIKVQIWWNFTWAVKSLKYCTLMGSFCKNHVKFQLKSTEELSLMTLKSHAKFKEKLTCCFSFKLRNFVNFNPNTQKSKNSTSMSYFAQRIWGLS